MELDESFQGAASHKVCIQRIAETWPAFLEKRRERLVQQDRHGAAAEKVAECILEDLFTTVLDWSISDLNNQIGYADLLLTKLGIKYLLIEAKRPGALAWDRHATEAALSQALRYAHEQKVRCICASDGVILYAADVEHGGLKVRVYCSLAGEIPPEDLWWLSVHGIYRVRPDAAAALAIPEKPGGQRVDCAADSETVPAILHPKYQIPARCFAYVGDANRPATWKLPYRLDDGSVDLKRLPKAIQCILTNYRGAKVGGIPERDIPEVLVRLAHAAASVGKMPHQDSGPSVYGQLAGALDQFGRMDEISKLPIA